MSNDRFYVVPMMIAIFEINFSAAALWWHTDISLKVTSALVIFADNDKIFQ